MNASGQILNWQKSPARLQPGMEMNFQQWTTDFLVDYIINIHHAYLQVTLPQTTKLLGSLVARKSDPILDEVNSIFSELSALLTTHNRHEEDIIFPYIKQIDAAYRRKEDYGNLFVRTLRKPLTNMEKDHTVISGLLNNLQDNTGNYTASSNATLDYKILIRRLKNINEDLTRHKFLETAILFPRAIAIENELLKL